MGKKKQESSSTLPDHLVERIIAMLPFPSIFQARCLSKSWKARLSSISSQEDESNKRLATSFQKQVGEWFSNWRTFSPVFIDNLLFTAYDRVSEKWLNMPTLHYLFKDDITPSNLQMEGPLLYGFSREPKGFPGDVYVVNVLTRSRRRLPRRPREGKNCVICFLKLVMDPDWKTYKVVLVCHEGWPSDHPNPDSNKIYLQIYDSTSGEWVNKTFSLSCDAATYGILTESADVYLKGMFYIAKLSNPLEFLAIHVNKGTLEEIQMPGVDTTEFESANLVVCNADIFMILHEGGWHDFRSNLWKIDLDSRQVSKLTQFQDHLGPIYFNSVGDGDRILLLGLIETQGLVRNGNPDHGVEEVEVAFGGHVSAYEVEKGTFFFLCKVPRRIDRERHGWIRSSFQPGLNPFLEV